MRDLLTAALERAGHEAMCDCRPCAELIEAMVDKLIEEIYAAYGPPF